jgi:RND superfamily putative drug exporter
MSPEGIDRIEPLKNAAKKAIKGTPLEGFHHQPRGTRGHLQGHVRRHPYDLLIAGSPPSR